MSSWCWKTTGFGSGSSGISLDRQREAILSRGEGTNAHCCENVYSDFFQLINSQKGKAILLCNSLIIILNVSLGEGGGVISCTKSGPIVAGV